MQPEFTNRLLVKNLKDPIPITIEPDEDEFVARITSPDLPLYGCGENPADAIKMLKREIESLIEDLSEDDNFSEQWLRIKSILKNQ